MPGPSTLLPMLLDEESLSSSPSQTPISELGPSVTSVQLHLESELDLTPDKPLQSIPSRSSAPLTDAAMWDRTLQRVIKGIVSIKSNRVRGFDTESAGSSHATGFVVDKERGIILSNRHVVNPAPTSATAVFQNYEEVTLQPFYHDPVHDFGFFRYDPKKIKFADVEEIELFPQGAKVGLAIKVCGNDSGEKLSILGSTLARVDREAPDYGSYNYNDFNTFYYQAGSGTSGGSSGSPVLDIHGRAVAINAGGKKKSASSFYLPLDRVVRALKLIQNQQAISRGTIQVEFRHLSYDKLKRLGLPDGIENELRVKRNGGTGLLTVQKVLPEGPGSRAGLEVGDVLLHCHDDRFGGRDIDNFISLWEVIDESVGKSIQLTVYRGKARKIVDVQVEDLFSITPKRFLELGRATIHDLSYQYARMFNLPCKGVFVAAPGMFSWTPSYRSISDFLLTHLNGRPLDSLDTLLEMLPSLTDGERVKYRFLKLGRSESKFDLVQIDRHFSPVFMYSRGSDGRWDRKLMPNPPTVPYTIAVSRGHVPENGLVTIHCRYPYRLAGIRSSSYWGSGLIVSLQPRPLVVASRVVVPLSVCDLRVTIGHLHVPATVVYLGLVAVLTFDPRCLSPNAKVPSISRRRELKIGDDVELLVQDGKHQILQKQTKIAAICAIRTTQGKPPRSRISNTEGIDLVDPFEHYHGGVLRDPLDRGILGIWLGFGEGWDDDGKYCWGNIGVNFHDYILPIIDPLKRGVDPELRTSGYEFLEMDMANATDLGLRPERAAEIDKIGANFGAVSRPIMVAGTLVPRVGQTGGLVVGDVLLEINGKSVGRIRDVTEFQKHEEVEVVVLRDGQEINVKVACQICQDERISRLVSWCGGTFHETRVASLEEATLEFFNTLKREGLGDPFTKVYVSGCLAGSPADENLWLDTWLLEVDGNKIDSLDDLLRVLLTLGNKEDEYVRLKILELKGRTRVVSMKPCRTFFPTWSLEEKGDQWICTEIA